MISYVAGELVATTATSVIIDHQGIGLEVMVPDSLLSKMPVAGSQVKIYTYFSVREDAMQLFGFATQADKDLFKLLITVSGIGPKGGLALMGTLSGDDIRFAILSEDAKTIATAPGIGAKTAKKLILELKDKIDMQQSIETALDVGEQAKTDMTQHSSALQADAVSALTASACRAEECCVISVFACSPTSSAVSIDCCISILSFSSKISFLAVFAPIPGAVAIVLASSERIANRISSPESVPINAKPPFGPIPLTVINSLNRSLSACVANPNNCIASSRTEKYVYIFT